MEITKEDLAVIEAASNDNIHFTLSTVHVQPGKLTATNGRILLTREVQMEEGEETFESFLVEPRDLKKAMGKAGGFFRSGENGTAKVRAADGSNGTLIPNGIETTILKQDGKYPAYDKVIPPEDNEDQKTVAINPHFLIRLLKGFKGVGVVKFKIRAEDKAIRIDGKTEDGRNVIGVIMPINKK